MGCDVGKIMWWWWWLFCSSGDLVYFGDVEVVWFCGGYVGGGSVMIW
jgi:hypothetical protein